MVNTWSLLGGVATFLLPVVSVEGFNIGTTFNLHKAAAGQQTEAGFPSMSPSTPAAIGMNPLMAVLVDSAPASPAVLVQSGGGRAFFPRNPEIRNPAVRISRESIGATPIFFTLILLASAFAPMASVMTAAAWTLGRIVYSRAMIGTPVSRRLPVSFVSYMALFVVLGGFSLYNGLHAIALLS